MRGIVAGLSVIALVACAPGDAASSGTLRVHAVEGTGEIYVDARERGDARRDLVISLPVGTHVVELRRGATVLASVRAEVRGDVETAVVLDPSRAATSDAAVSGRVEVRTDVPGAEILIDGVVAGLTPLAIDLAPGPHHVVLRAPDRIDHDEEIFVGAGSSLAIDVALDPSP